MQRTVAKIAAVAVVFLSAAIVSAGTTKISLEIYRPANSVSFSNFGNASAQAAAQVMAAQSKLNVVRSRIAKALEGDAELLAAQQNADDARRVFSAVRKVMIAHLGSDPGYVSALFELERREKRLSAVRESGGTFDAIVVEAKSVMEARSTVRSIEQAACKDDLDYDAARQATLDANARIAQLKSDVQSRIVSDPDFIAARDQLRSVRQQLVRQPQ